MDVSDETIRIMDIIRNDNELAAVLPEGDANLPSEVLPSAEAIENVPLPDADIGAVGPSVEVMGTVCEMRHTRGQLMFPPLLLMKEVRGLLRTIMRRASKSILMRFRC